jgi:hypothetical protein
LKTALHHCFTYHRQFEHCACHLHRPRLAMSTASTCVAVANAEHCPWWCPLLTEESALHLENVQLAWYILVYVENIPWVSVGKRTSSE